MLSILFLKKHSTASVSSLTCPGVIQWEKALKSTTRPIKCVAQKARVIVGFRAMTSALSLLAHFYWQTRILLYFDFGRFWAFAKLPRARNGRFEFAWDRCLCSYTVLWVFDTWACCRVAATLEQVWVMAWVPHVWSVGRPMRTNSVTNFRRCLFILWWSNLGLFGFCENVASSSF